VKFARGEKLLRCLPPVRRAASCAVALAALATLNGTPVPAGSALAASARSASTLRVKAEGKLHLTKVSGSTLYDEGSAHGTLSGTVQVRFRYNGNPTVSAQITIISRSGSIRAQGNGRMANPTSATPSFAGSATIVGGTGRYRNARGTGKFYGVFYRRSYALTVQTEGMLHY
jgi:hypothetical protein